MVIIHTVVPFAPVFCAAGGKMTRPLGGVLALLGNAVIIVVPNCNMALEPVKRRRTEKARRESVGLSCARAMCLQRVPVCLLHRLGLADEALHGFSPL